MRLTTPVKQKVRAYYEREYLKVIPPSTNLDSFIKNIISNEVVNSQISYISKHLQFKINDKILDLGSGLGLQVIKLRQLGFDSYGYEIEKDLYTIGKEISLENGQGDIFYYSSNGAVPVEPNTFDYAYSYMVLEHVADIKEYIKEMIRVLKPGGNAMLVTCNYNLNYEFHYQIFLPLFSKKLTKLILKLIGRNSKFVDQLNFVSPQKIENILKKLESGQIISSVNLGGSEFLGEISNPNLHSSLFIKAGALLKKLGLLQLMVRSGFYNPLVYVITKK